LLEHTAAGTALASLLVQTTKFHDI